MIFEDRTDMLSRSAWLSGLMSATGYHDPKSYPKSADELLGRKHEQPAMTVDQWRAIISHLTS